MGLCIHVHLIMHLDVRSDAVYGHLNLHASPEMCHETTHSIVFVGLVLHLLISGNHLCK